MANKHMIRCESMQIKTTMNHHYTPTKTAKMKKLTVPSVGENMT